MDFIGNKCPVCEKYFHSDDDVVVCPECGTPHHRECYESLGHCFNAELHSEGYDYSEDEEQNNNVDVIICKSCGKENDKYQFFCKYCAAPLQSEERNRSNADQQQKQQPFGIGVNGMPYGVPFLDPLGGVPAETDLGDGVTVGEAAKYVKQNTPYFARVFSNIKLMNRSKFNFAAALFSGGYLLYRKMYKLGAIITGIELAIYMMTIYFQVAYKDLFSRFENSYSKGINKSKDFLLSLDFPDVLKLYVPFFGLILMLVIMLIVGLKFNRWYLNHCKSEVIRIKQNAKEDENPETLLQTQGGVNTPLAISLLVSRYFLTLLINMLI